MNLKFLIFYLLVAAMPAPSLAQAVKVIGPKDNTDINQWSDSVVRIFSQDGGDGFQTADNSDVLFGTGFLINDAGYIVTNNHVASRSPDTSEPHGMCVVLETVTTSDGPKRYLHKATAIWFSPADDLAVLQCTGMHAKPMPFDLTPPQSGDQVHSLGYPKISDQVAGGAGEFSNFFRALADFVSPQWSEQSDWEISDVVNQKTWRTYCKPTRTDGRIRQADLIEGAWGGNDDSVEVPVIQHSLEILPGNSGGPLVSNAGGVIGVVGDGIRDVENDNENVSTEYATTIAPLIEWLNSASIPGVDDQHHYYQLQFAADDPAGTRTPFLTPAMMTMIILGLLLALGFELIILRATWEWGAHSHSALPPVPGTPAPPSVATAAPSHAMKLAPGGAGSGKVRFHGIPIHMPHPQHLFSLAQMHAKATGLTLVLIVASLAYLAWPAPHAQSQSAQDQPPSASSTTINLSSTELDKLAPVIQIQPPPAPSLANRVERDIGTLWSLVWRGALVGLAAMVIWRLLVAVAHFLKGKPPQPSKIP